MSKSVIIAFLKKLSQGNRAELLSAVGSRAVDCLSSTPKDFQTVYDLHLIFCVAFL